MRNLCTASCLCSGVSKYVKQEITDLLLCGVTEYVKSKKPTGSLIGFINI